MCFIQKLDDKLYRQDDTLLRRQQINMEILPDVLCHIIPSKQDTISNYNTHSKDQFNVTKCKLDLFKTSIVPNAINQWEFTNDEARTAKTINFFQKHMPNNMETPYVFFSCRKGCTHSCLRTSTIPHLHFRPPG